MGDFTDPVENSVLDHALGVTVYNRPSNLFLGLCTSQPVDADTGSLIDELSGGAYARQAIDSWNAATGRMITNETAIAFPAVTAATLGIAKYFVVLDTSVLATGGIIAFGQIDPEKTMTSGNTYSFAAGDIDMSFNVGGVADYLANKLLDHVFKDDSFTAPNTYFLAMAGATIDDYDTGSTLDELITNSGDRSEISDGFETASGGLSANLGSIQLLSRPTTWGTVAAYAVLDAATAGNLLFHGTFATIFNVDASDGVNVGTGKINFSLD